MSGLISFIKKQEWPTFVAFSEKNLLQGMYCP